MTFTEYEIKILNEVFDQISESAPAQLDTTAIISKYRLSPRTFVRAYKKLFGKTPSQHHHEVAMLYAKERIKEGVQIKTVARELGYHDIANFSRKFKKVIGYPPSKVTLY